MGGVERGLARWVWGVGLATNTQSTGRVKKGKQEAGKKSRSAGILSGLSVFARYVVSFVCVCSECILVGITGIYNVAMSRLTRILDLAPGPLSIVCTHSLILLSMPRMPGMGSLTKHGLAKPD